MFSTKEASEFSGATPRQLQWWDERGALVVGRHKGYRAYTATDVRAAWVLRSAMQSGWASQGVLKGAKLYGIARQLTADVLYVVVHHGGLRFRFFRDQSEAFALIASCMDPCVCLKIPEELRFALDERTQRAA